ncbi:MAG: hypothetical protein A2566_02565 [Candidatus Zambryskibacteria bacterium RIFOXYD1_FULL_40_13]|nr:MAG: hypothetical protein UT25_C0007G0003 [Parcubacteria group bacterium GW2011_GWC1_39_12]KKR18600.1 MAG: hypothetical protein UT49_C0006G0009 [Parcubacteria group bacterium GW2011_GWF1_39_37]KKR34798.1 MAG: hypothetical protein UT68_C0008G0011 [Parcubacteria group bacterium GW2011_GWC2_40_10]KKR52745.1 MAG: hypothetical protein UT89_C0001G0253 [Parcubacteria group bacterium GW2011_GWE1_40_20]KKR69075.1 MAG: hypothetical protein UU11_C0003G0069 [Parcubacteria group bacterium GW2011_GWF2_40_
MDKQTKTNQREGIYVRLDQYDDIFSDFDMRPYSDRALSVDFLDEIKRAVSGKDGGDIELILHVPENKRDESREATIKERLGAHFLRHYQLLQKEKRDVLKTGIIMVLLGIICMIIATLVHFGDSSREAFLSFLIVFLDPVAVFLLWEGMDQIIFNSKNINPELGFYHKMTDSHEWVQFRAY